MKKLSILWIIIFSTSFLFGQDISLDISTPSKQMFSGNLNNVCQFRIFNNQTTSISGFIQITINRENEGVVSVLKSQKILFYPGLKISDQVLGLGGANMNVLRSRSGFENVNSGTFSFPDGKYSYCVEILNVENATIAKECTQFEQSNPLAFFLVYPFDGQVLKNSNPVFTWTPLINPNQSNIQYRVRWVESKKKISKNQNTFLGKREFFKVMNVEENLQAYTIEFPKFNPKRKYYWQVEAYSGNSLLAKSDIWEFNFEKEVEDNKLPNTYVKVDLESYGKTHVFSGNYLSFEWLNNYSETPLEYEIIDSKNMPFEIEKEKRDLRAKNGKNYFQFYVKGIVKEDKIYTLRIKGSEKTHSIKFKKVSL